MSKLALFFIRTHSNSMLRVIIDPLPPILFTVDIKFNFRQRLYFLFAGHTSFYREDIAGDNCSQVDSSVFRYKQEANIINPSIITAAQNKCN